MTAKTQRRSAILSWLAPFWETDQSLTLLLAFLVLTVFVVGPLADLGGSGALLVDFVFALVLLSGIGVVARTHAWFRVLGVIAILAMAARVLAVFLPRHETLVARAGVSLVFCTLLACVIGERVLRQGPINHYRIQGAIAAYLLVGVMFAFAYDLAYQLSPETFQIGSPPRTESDLQAGLLYFSIGTLTTVGYGDITAVHAGTRSLVMLEAVIGQLFPAILIARLVGLSIRG